LRQRFFGCEILPKEKKKERREFSTTNIPIFSEKTCKMSKENVENISPQIGLWF
jgi:hypothetical protein